MSLDSGQERLARRAAARGLPVREVARIVGVHEDEMRAAWPRLAEKEIGRRAASRLVRPEYNERPDFAEGSASVWAPQAMVLPRRLTSRTIGAICARYYGYSVEVFLGSRRFWPLAHQRQMAMVLCRDILNDSTTQIGLALGGRDHTTILHGIGMMRDRMRAEDSVWAQEYSALKEIIFAEFPRGAVR